MSTEINVTNEIIDINVTTSVIDVNVTNEIIVVEAVNGAYPLPSTVYSVFGRTGSIVAENGDYTTTLVTEGTNLYFTTQRVWNALSTIAPLSIASGVISISQSSASSNGYLSSIDWNVFNNKQNALGYTPVPETRTLTINGTTYDLSANRTWTIDGGVTSVFGRTGAITAQSGDYNTSLVTENTNLYFTNARARNAISLTTTGISGPATYDSATGILNIPQYQGGVSSFNTRTGAITLTSGDVTGALGFTPYNATNPNGFISGITSSDVITALGYTPVTNARTLTINGTTYDLSANRTWTIPTVTSVGITTTASALSITSSPITTSGNIGVNFSGSSTQYVAGDGTLVNFPTIITEAQNLICDVYNETGATLTKGTVVYINGGHGNLPTVTKALATSDPTSAQTFGIVQSDITNMNNGHVVVIGNLTDLNTQAYAEGTQLYLSSTTAGAYTSVKQYAPAHLVYVGIVVRSHPTQGIIQVKIQNGFEMDELHNVSAQSPVNGGILQYVTSTGLWTAVAGTTTNIAEGTNLYYTDARSRAALSFTAGSGAYNSTTGVITIPTNTSQLTNGANFITLASLSAGTGISYNSTTGVITNTITQYTDALARAAISLTTTGTSGAATYNSTTGVLNIPQYTDAYVGTVTSVGLSAPTGFSVSGSPVTSSGTLALAFAAGYSLPTTASQTNWDTAYTNRITSLTTTGSSGAATLVSNTLNVPNYTLAGLGGQPLATNLTSLASLSYVSSSFVKMTAAGTFSLDTNTYYLASNPSGFTSNTGTVTSIGLSSVTSGVTIGSTPVTTSGTITISIATATSTQNGLLSSTDWSTFNGKANALSGTINTIAYWDSATTIASLALATYPSLTELSYVKGVTSAIQTQLNSKQDTLTLTTTGTSGAATLVGNTLNIPQYSGGGGVTSLSAIGSTPNANGATITGSVLNLQPASASFGGVVTTGTQTFAGAKTFSTTSDTTFNGNITINAPSGNANFQMASASTFKWAFGYYQVNNNFRLYNYNTAADAFNVASGTSYFGILTNTIGSALQVNGNVAIGYSASTAAPTNGLQVAGRVYIGTGQIGTQTEILQIKAAEATIDLQTTTATSYSGVNMYDSSGVLGASFQFGNASAVTLPNTFFFGPRNATASMAFVRGTGATVSATIDSSGNFGINTTTIGSKLQVNGSAAIGYSASTAAPTNGLSVAGTVNIGTNTSVTTAALQVSSTTQGFLPPVMTTTQKNAITSPATGLVIFDSTLGKLCVFSTTWQTITSV